MQIISASWLITCNKNNSIIKNGAIVYNKKIIDIDTLDNIKNRYPNIKIKNLEENSVIMPGLINSHVHMEFSSNTTSLKYGNFITWLNSVIKERENISLKSTSKLISNQLDFMKKTGTTSIGAISSYSYDLEACKNSPINTVFFVEAIGSKADMIDTLFSDFKARLKEVQSYKRDNFIPAIAIHSPYSVHPFLIRECLKIAKKENLAVSSHFLESPEEYEWLHNNKGSFLTFFKNLFGQDKAISKPLEFLNQFKNIKDLSFTHCVEASNNDLEKIKDLNATIIHCPTSNRLLNNTKLNIDNLKKHDLKFSIGTDGLSSNNSLSMFDELRNALMIHENINPNDLSNTLLKTATKNSALALGLNKGELSHNNDADFICISLPNIVEDKNLLALNIILHTKYVDNTIIGGENV